MKHRPSYCGLTVRSYRGCYWYVAAGRHQLSRPCASKGEAVRAMRQIAGGCGYV